MTFASALLAEPEPFQRYVILHELLHLRVPNHGRLFKAYMSAYLPGWKEFTARIERAHKVPLEDPE